MNICRYGGNNVQAIKLPYEYGNGQCLLIANDVKAEFGGEIVLLYPNTYQNPIGYWVDEKKIGGKTHYIDYENQGIFNSRESIIDWYILIGK